MSNLNVRFGRKVPDGAVNLAWVAVPETFPAKNVLVSDVASTIAANVAASYSETLSKTIAKITWSLEKAGNSVSTNGNALPHVHSPITVLPPISDETGAWRVRVTDGVIRQVAKLTKRELAEESTSWLKLAALDAGWGEGDELVLVYTVQDKLMPSAGGCWRTIDGRSRLVALEYDYPCHRLSPKRVQIGARAAIAELTSLTINGEEQLTVPLTAASPKSASGNVKLDATAYTVTLGRTVSDYDDIRATYYYLPGDIIYHGYFDHTAGRFLDLDLNPTAGHTYDSLNPEGAKPGSDLLSSVVYLYLVPSAAYSVRDAWRDGDLKIYRAVDYGVYDVLRWAAAPAIVVPEETLPDDDAETAPRGVYGEAIYDEYYFTDDIPMEYLGVAPVASHIGRDLLAGGTGMLLDMPSACVLAKLYVTASGTVESVKVIDTRSRGGGLGEQWEAKVATMHGDELIEAESLWDTAGWEGAPVMLSGVVVFDLPRSVLAKFTEREVEEIVARHIAAGIKPIIRYT